MGLRLELHLGLLELAFGLLVEAILYLVDGLCVLELVHFVDLDELLLHFLALSWEVALALGVALDLDKGGAFNFFAERSFFGLRCFEANLLQVCIAFCCS